ncbi:hypothetical protein GF415_03465 [Candidatus Micrarchaeota archaeon]|nr:hypothetical protein [Candidatus Micrarchaeota archaeon]
MGFERRKAKRYARRIADDVSIFSFRVRDFFFLRSSSGQISHKQLRALQKAFDKGYYKIPRKTTIASLAAESDSSPSNFAEHLRKAESKAFLIMSNVLKKL